MEVQIRISEKDNGTAVKKLTDPLHLPDKAPEEEDSDMRFHLSYGIVRKNKGMLQVQNDRDEGSIFTIRLPIARQKQD